MGPRFSLYCLTVVIIVVISLADIDAEEMTFVGVRVLLAADSVRVYLPEEEDGGRYKHDEHAADTDHRKHPDVQVVIFWNRAAWIKTSCVVVTKSLQINIITFILYGFCKDSEFGGVLDYLKWAFI